MKISSGKYEDGYNYQKKNKKIKKNLVVFSCSFMKCWYVVVWPGGLGVFFWDRGDATNRSSEVFFCTASRVSWWRSRLCSSTKIFKCAYLKSVSIYVYCVSILTQIYIYMYARYTLWTLKMHIQKPNSPKTRPKNLIKFACFSCASDSLLSFSSSSWLWHPKSHRMDDLQSRTAENPKIGGYPLVN